MVDFSNLKALEVTGETLKEYTFDLIPGEPSIFLAAAHDSNKAFLDERLRLSIEEAAKFAAEPRNKRKATQTPEELAADIEADRDRDRKLIARACARRWGTARLYGRQLLRLLPRDPQLYVRPAAELRGEHLQLRPPAGG
jgi:hypothetical protein